MVLAEERCENISCGRKMVNTNKKAEGIGPPEKQAYLSD